MIASTQLIVTGVVCLIAGIAALAFPAVSFVIGGIARLVWARMWTDSTSYWIVLISGAVSVLLGVIILANIVSSADTLLGVFLGIEHLMVAVPMILMGLRQR